MNVFLKSRNLKEGCISDVVSLGDFVYISAQNGQGCNLEKQTQFAMEGLLSNLQEFQMGMRHIVKTTVYLTNIQDKDRFLQMYKTYFEAPFPACSIVEVSHLENNAHIAIEAVAVNTLRYEKNLKNHSCDGCNGC